MANIAILVLAGFVGFAVISKVPNTLHTPLMSGTNAIHGIVAARRVCWCWATAAEPTRQAGRADHRCSSRMVFGTLNVIGGFLVTDRMLGMFKGQEGQRKGSGGSR